MIGVAAKCTLKRPCRVILQGLFVGIFFDINGQIRKTIEQNRS